MQKSHIITLIACACLAGCGPDVEAIPQVSAQMASDMGVEKAQLQRGRDIYMAHCHQCHERVKPAKIDPEYWREILPHMSQNARLNAAQLRDLQTYLIAAHGAVYHLDQ
jgi:mono/diheme cytochrome c family protein